MKIWMLRKVFVIAIFVYKKGSMSYKFKVRWKNLFFFHLIIYMIYLYTPRVVGNPTQGTIRQEQSLGVLCFIRVKVYSVVCFATFLHSFYAFLSYLCLISFFVTSFAIGLEDPEIIGVFCILLQGRWSTLDGFAIVLFPKINYFGAILHFIGIIPVGKS